jgi:hypothetical protein
MNPDHPVLFLAWLALYDIPTELHFLTRPQLLIRLCPLPTGRDICE